MDNPTLSFFLVWLGVTLMAGISVLVGGSPPVAVRAWLLISGALWALRLGGCFV